MKIVTKTILATAIYTTLSGCATPTTYKPVPLTNTHSGVGQDTLTEFCGKVSQTSRTIMRARYDRAPKPQVLNAMNAEGGNQVWVHEIAHAAYRLPISQIGPAAFADQMGDMCLQTGETDDILSQQHVERMPSAQDIVTRQQEDYAAKQESPLEKSERILAQAREKDVANARWRTRTEVERIDDSITVVVSAPSIDRVWNHTSIRRYEPATIYIQCMNNQTSLYFSFNGNIMADHGGYQRVTIRIDGGQPFARNMTASNSNTAIGLWGGNQAIPVIRQMFGKDQLIVQATPFGESSQTVTFNITGLEGEIQPLRQACNW